jgi:hypothetical protein
MKRCLSTIKKSDTELQVVYGEVYAPMLPDTDGDFMTEDEIIKMAHKFVKSGRLGAVDTQHDRDIDNNCSVVESFIEQSDSSVLIKGAWVVGVHIPDDELWAKVVDGTFNGFSMEGMAVQKETVIEVEIPQTIKGVTADKQDHAHSFVVKFSDDGEFLGGTTNEVDGHTHLIKQGTTTDVAGAVEHTHQYSFMEGLVS